MSEQNQLEHRLEVLEQEKTQLQQRVEVLEEQMRQLLPVETQRDVVNIHTESEQKNRDELPKTELDTEERVRQLEEELEKKEKELDDEKQLRKQLEDEVKKKGNELDAEKKLRQQLEDDLKNHIKERQSEPDLKKLEIAQKLKVPYHIILNVFKTISTEKEKDLLAAVQSGDTLKVRVLLEIGAYIETTTTNDNRTPLHHASAKCNVQIVRVLLDCGANVHATSTSKLTPLHLAAQKGELEICKLLISTGASMDVLDKYEQSPFLMAVDTNHLALCKFFIDSNCNVNSFAYDHEKSPIHNALTSDKQPLAKLLLQSGADISGCYTCKSKKQKATYI